MSLIAEVNLYDNPLLFGETFDRVPNAVGSYEDAHYVTDEARNAHYVFFWWVTGCEPEAFDEAQEADPTVRDSERLTTIGDRHLYRITTAAFPPEQPLMYPFFRDRGVTTIASRRDADGLHVQARFPDRETLHDFLELGESIADAAEVVSLYEEDPTAPDDDLTAKQREALTRAHESGYFDTPSRATLDELAAEFDVTPQTLSRHLRVGVEKLVAAAVGSDSEDG